MRDGTLRSLQRVCTAGLDSVSLRRELAQRVARDVPYDAYAFSTCDPETGLMAHTVAEGISHSLGRAYLERLYPNECATTSMDAARRGSAIFSLIEASAEARDTFRSHGVTSQLHLALSVDCRLWATWCIMRADTSVAQMRRSVSLLSRAAPYIARGLKAATFVDQAHAATGAADANRDAAASAPGVVVLDGQNHAVVRTTPAKRWLADLADSGATAPDDVPLCIVSMAIRLRSTRSDVPEELVLRLRGGSGQWYTLRGSLAEPDPTGSASVVVVVRPAARREVAPILGRLYSLSQREREVVAAVARGDATKCIATSLGLSPHTVEEHLERACRKIGVRGRKALVAKLFVDGYASTLMAPSPALGHLSAAPAHPTRS